MKSKKGKSNGQCSEFWSPKQGGNPVMPNLLIRLKGLSRISQNMDLLPGLGKSVFISGPGFRCSHVGIFQSPFVRLLLIPILEKRLFDKLNIPWTEKIIKHDKLNIKVLKLCQNSAQ
jgi:hypothetical protein